VPKLPQLEPAHVVEENNLKVASLLDLAGTKASVIQVRAEAKDYLDLDALMRLGGVDLATALSAAHALYGQTFNPEVNQRRAGRAAWQEFRKHESPVPDLEEVRRRAREDWRKNILTENEWSG
jgi:Nucleotidyl transferase AbiEii toxin, Type IV TA system